MGKIELKYIGKFKPLGLYEVHDEKVEELLKTGDWILPKEEEDYSVKVSKKKRLEG